MAVEADDHDLLKRDIEAPDFAAHLSVHLDGNLRRDGHQHGLLRQRLQEGGINSLYFSRKTHLHIAVRTLDRLIARYTFQMIITHRFKCT